ncbi:hypothetical protein K504DRAFT_94667 [Pleomassaria siparia CBS 279.74]|uniref:Uncharacterized protein n=1 Tax=Pleomassaria siparia CBS 279.74 TaxID=1314801 RepID=A0A6G1JYW0_9PLEO|nr:hypothetical protein K504DRAFT_94667 [Pleomassaria siparia CBS 279.74]
MLGDVASASRRAQRQKPEISEAYKKMRRRARIGVGEKKREFWGEDERPNAFWEYRGYRWNVGEFGGAKQSCRVQVGCTTLWDDTTGAGHAGRITLCTTKERHGKTHASSMFFVWSDTVDPYLKVAMQTTPMARVLRRLNAPSSPSSNIIVKYRHHAKQANYNELFFTLI